MSASDRSTFGGFSLVDPPLVVGEAEELVALLREARAGAPEAEHAGLDVAIEKAIALTARGDDARIAVWVRRQLGSDGLGPDRVKVTKRIREEFPQMALREAAELADLALADQSEVTPGGPR